MLEPNLEHDKEFIKKYHETMEKESRTKNSGRKLLKELRGRNTRVIDVGSSDWVIYTSGGQYERDKDLFLRFVIGTIEKELEGKIERGILKNWLNQRLEQIEEGELMYIAHQIDIMGRKIL